MDLLGYLRDKGLVSQQQYTKLRDSVVLKGSTAFQELYADSIGELHGVPYETLEQSAVEAAKAAGRVLGVIRETKELSCDDAAYSAIGGLDEKVAGYVLLLKHTKTGERLVFTTRPDDQQFLLTLKNAYRDSSYKMVIGTPAVYYAVYSTYIEPAVVSRMARAVPDNQDMNSPKQAHLDSEARRMWVKLANIGLERGASDIHFIPTSKECLVVYRIDGINTKYTSIPKFLMERVVNIILNDAGVNVRHPKDPLDGKLRYSMAGNPKDKDAVDLRLSVIPTKAGSDCNVRYLSGHLYTFEETGMSPENIAKYKGLLELPTGMVVQVGPTGSGKTTTLYAGLAHIMQDMRNIIEVADPIEYLLDGISQIDVDEEHMTFETALKAILRHDPDVIVVGELREGSVASLAVRGANTGHLVIATLHTNDSIGVFERMINMGVDPYALGEVMAAVIGQRLVRKLCPKCKKAYTLDLDSKLAKFYRIAAAPGETKATFYRPVGCAHCKNTGYVGRVALNEILIVDSNIRAHIQRHSVRRVFEEQLRKTGFVSLYQDGIAKAREGITSLEELTKLAADTLSFKG